MTSGKRAIRCANCGEFAGPHFCPHCGQKLVVRRGPIPGVARDILSDWLSLDSRLFRSLRELVRPGRLSELYVGGKRAPFLRPFQLYLLTSVVLFSTALTFEAPDSTEFNIYIGGKRVGAEARGPVRRSLEILKSDTWLGRWQIALAGDRLDRFRALPKQQVLETLAAGWRRMLPSALILFVPFLALGLKLLYVREKAAHTLYVDHLVFALHYQSALFLAVSLAWLAARLAGGSLGAQVIAYVVIAIAMPVIYLPLALRRFYRQSRLWTGVKTFTLLVIYSQLLGTIVNFSALLTIWRS